MQLGPTVQAHLPDTLCIEKKKWWNTEKYLHNFRYVILIFTSKIIPFFIHLSVEHTSVSGHVKDIVNQSVNGNHV